MESLPLVTQQDNLTDLFSNYQIKEVKKNLSTEWKHLDLMGELPKEIKVKPIDVDKLRRVQGNFRQIGEKIFKAELVKAAYEQKPEYLSEVHDCLPGLFDDGKRDYLEKTEVSLKLWKIIQAGAVSSAEELQFIYRILQPDYILPDASTYDPEGVLRNPHHLYDPEFIDSKKSPQRWMQELRKHPWEVFTFYRLLNDIAGDERGLRQQKYEKKAILMYLFPYAADLANNEQDISEDIASFLKFK